MNATNGQKITANILTIGGERSTKNGKRLMNITVQDVLTGTIYDVAVWLNNAAWAFQKDERVMLYMTSTMYQGKPQYSASIDSMAKIMQSAPSQISPTVLQSAPSAPTPVVTSPAPPVPAPTNAQPTQAQWNQKERRSHRRACVAISAGLLRDEEKVNAPDVDRINMVILMADKLVTYVYGEDDGPVRADDVIDSFPDVSAEEAPF